MRVFIVGLDGGTWKVFDKMFECGVMPNFKSIVKNGFKGILKSTIPPVTPVAWTSFQTGCTPEVHGVRDFINFNRKEKKFYFVNSTTIKVPTIWEIVSQNSGKIISIDVPMTYPIPKINGIMITGLMTPREGKDMAYPSQILYELENKLGDKYQLISAREFHNKKKNPKMITDKMIKYIEHRKKACLYLLEREKDWDVFMVHFQPVDIIQHTLWYLIDEEHPNFNVKDFLIVKRFYQYLDRCIGEIIDKVLKYKDVLLIFISDHGFQPNYVSVNIYRWLQENGFINFSKFNLVSYVFKIIRRLDRWNLRNKIFSKKRKTKLKSFELSSLDWNRPQVFCYASLYAQLYLFNTNRELLIKKLQKLSYEGIKVIDKMYFPKKIDEYSPDIILHPVKHFSFHSRNDGSPIYKKVDVFFDYEAGTHDIDGIFVLSGINKDLNLKPELNIIDIAPSILSFLGLPIPDYIEGISIFKETSRTGKYYKTTKKEVVPKDTEELKKILESLGYM